MKIGLTIKQKILFSVIFFAIAIFGFMLKLPASFRHIDKELHATFYFLAAAFLNVLFVKTSLVKHMVFFVSLYLFGMAIEYSQAYSNKFFRKRIHGRFDPEDLQWNLKGLLAFSLLWVICIGVILIYNKATLKKKVDHADAA